MVWFKWPTVTPQKLAACSAAAKKLATIDGVLSVDFGTFFACVAPRWHKILVE